MKLRMYESIVIFENVPSFEREVAAQSGRKSVGEMNDKDEVAVGCNEILTYYII